MLFNSTVFVAFFAVTYGLYLLARRHHRLQNRLLLVASYIFYGFWDVRFLTLIAVSTIIDFAVGRRLAVADDPRRRKALLASSVVANLTILGFFKYFDFFAENIAGILRALGMQADDVTLRIVLPVGISFYTFQTMSYTIDVYRRKLPPEKDFLDFALFVSFFPQLVAGPIERAINMLPQITRARRILPAQVKDGLFLILWGYYKKVVIADNIGRIADQIFNSYTNYEGLDNIIGVFAFAIQIYCDFSGYSDIARGTAKLMGFELMVNFNLPYFALNPSDLWERWHISLSSWLRDYLYIPLGGGRAGNARIMANLLITMLLGGLWHGAAWNFVLWGAFHGLILAIYRVVDKTPRGIDLWDGRCSKAGVLARMGLMFPLILIGLIIFRSASVGQMIFMFSHLGLSASAHSAPLGMRVLFFTLPLLAVQTFQYWKRDLMALVDLPTGVRCLIYTYFLLWLLVFGAPEATEFFYFQF